jgi:hypothetical protein
MNENMFFGQAGTQQQEPLSMQALKHHDPGWGKNVTDNKEPNCPEI